MLFRRTALAEAELEYNEGHVSTSVYIKFPIVHLPVSLQGQLGRYQAVTYPSNDVRKIFAAYFSVRFCFSSAVLDFIIAMETTQSIYFCSAKNTA